MSKLITVLVASLAVLNGAVVAQEYNPHEPDFEEVGHDGTDGSDRLPKPNLTEVLIKRSSPIIKAMDQDFADPAILHENNTWYAFATNNHAAINVQLATSPDFNSWTFHSGVDLLPKMPGWVSTNKPSVWAPHVIKNGQGEYVLYFSGRVASAQNHHCVGAAVSDKVDGTYVAQDQPLYCDLSKGGAIDASGFKDVDGTHYVAYKVDGNSIGHGGLCGNTVAPIVPTPIMLQRVKNDGFTPDGNAVQILDRDDSDGPLVEAPSLMRTSNGKYVLFFSSSCYATDSYDVSYAIADHVTGPYTKYQPFAVTGSWGLMAPGGATVAQGGKRLVFHANNGNGGRSMYTAMINIDTTKHVVSA